MPGSRRKVSRVLKDFRQEIDQLERFDADNQGENSRLNKKQLHLLTESIFFSAYRSYEQFVRDVFILYCLEKNTQSGKKVRSYLDPTSFHHAERMLQSSMQFIDWNSPELLIERADLYLKDGFPIKDPYIANTGSLNDFKHIRNHIAHRSENSLNKYQKVVRRHYGFAPLQTPEPGEYLLLSEKATPNRYKLLSFFEKMKELSTAVT